jgi:predicted metalloprotease with PDZ domain
LARAGLITHKELLESLSAEIKSVETRPGNLVQSLTESSFDTWIDFYRPHENSANTSISYYSRGAVAGLMLDCELRRRSSGKVSLDDVMIQLYERFRETGYDNDDFRSLCEEMTGEDFSSWFNDYVHQANSFAYADSLKTLGLHLTADPRSDRDVGSERGPQSEAVTLGITLRDADGQAKIAAIRADSTVVASGLNLDDEVLAVNNRRVNATTFGEELRGFEPGTTVKLLIARRGELQEIDVPVAAKPVEKWHLARVPKPNRKQKKQWSDWLDTKIESIDEASLGSDLKREASGDSQK